MANYLINLKLGFQKLIIAAPLEFQFPCLVLSLDVFGTHIHKYYWNILCIISDAVSSHTSQELMNTTTSHVKDSLITTCLWK